MLPTGVVLMLLLAFIINRVRVNNRVAKVKAEQERLATKFWDCRKAVSKLLNSCLIGAEFPEVNVIKSNLTNLNLIGNTTIDSFTSEEMKEYIDNYQSFNDNSNNITLIKNLDKKRQLSADAAKYAAKWNEQKSGDVYKVISELCVKLANLTFDKLDYSNVKDSFNTILICIKSSVDNLKLAINTNNANFIEKFVDEVAASEQQYTALYNKYGIVITNDNNKINKAKNAKQDIRNKISAMEAHCNRRGVSAETAARTRQQCSTMNSRLDTYSDFDMVQLYLMYEVMSSQVDETCMEAQVENEAYEQQVYEEEQREEAAAQQQRDDEYAAEQQAIAEQQEQDDRDNDYNNSNDDYDSSDSSDSGGGSDD
jgi:hypothetical protein